MQTTIENILLQIAAPNEGLSPAMTQWVVNELRAALARQVLLPTNRCHMQRFNLRLTTEELKELQGLLERTKARATKNPRGVKPWSPTLDDVMTKIIVTQVEAETVPDYHRVQSEADLAF